MLSSQSSESCQKALKLAFGVHREPKDAPRKLVLSCLQQEGDELATALAVAMKAGGHKLAYVGACIGKHESYVSMLRKGTRAIHEQLVAPLCAATGSNLLRQVWDALDAINASDDAREIERLAQLLREAA